MRFVRLALGSLAFLLLAAVAVQAQSVRWETADQSSVSTTLQLIFEDCSPEGQPDLPGIPGVTFDYVGQSESMNIVNFQMTRSVALTYMLRSRQPGPVEIPAFTVKTNKGAIRVPAFNAAAPAAPLDSVASAKLIPERTRVWAGEVFGLDYELTASRRNNPQISPTFDWNAAPLVAEDWSKPEVTESVVGGERRVNVVFHTRASAKTPNTIKLEAATHLLSIQTGTIGFGIISQPRMETVSVTSDQPTIEIRPLPPPPPGFTGAVGQFKLTSKIVPEKAAVGEPITWTLELSGTGNWPDLEGLPPREVSNDFQVVQPKAKRTPVEGKLFDVTLAEDVVLVPSKQGNYTLGPVSFTYFDPKVGGYETISTPSASVVVTPPGAPQFDPTPAAAPAAEDRPESTAPPKAAPAPAAIPRDPLPGSAAARAPMTGAVLTTWLVAPFAGVLILWAWLAVRRALHTDPVKPRREARERLARTLSHLQTATGADRAYLLLAWQRDTAFLWQIRHSAPPAKALPDPGWAALWEESDRALYGAKAALPSDWVARAQEALAAKRLPGFQFRRVFLPQNLMPFAAAIAFATFATTALVRAGEASVAKPDASGPGAAMAAYQQGEFTKAEKGWRDAIARTPTDWIAHHNLSLALAQQERRAESAAHATVAFVQEPANPSIRWHFAHTADSAGFVSRQLAEFLNPGTRHAIARAASPATWHLVLVGAAFLAALAFGWMLSNAYGARRRQMNVGALVLLTIALGAATSAATGVTAYGVSAHPDAVVVARAGILRSIPTEADTTQKTTPLSPGSLAITDKIFLGWVRLAFENGQTGWVRKEELVRFWE